MRDLTEGSIAGHIVRMAVPMAIGMIFQMLYQLIDLYFVAQIGDAAMAGVSAAVGGGDAVSGFRCCALDSGSARLRG